MTKKVIVVGSGFGGLASAIRLKAKGYDVTLLEKHPDLGEELGFLKRKFYLRWRPHSNYCSLSY